MVSKDGISDIEKLHASLTCQHKDKLSVRCNCPESAAAQKELDAYRFTAHHEATHAQEHHMTVFGLTCLAVPTLTHIVSELLQMNKATGVNTLIKAITNLLLVTRCRRYLEERADDRTPDTRELLQGGLQLLTDLQALRAKLRGTTDSTNHNLVPTIIHCIS